MNTSFAQRQQELQAQIDRAREELAVLEGARDKIDGELAALSDQRRQYQLLGEVCDALDELGDMGAASLFWGEGLTGFNPEERLQQIRTEVGEFSSKLAEIEQRKLWLMQDIDVQQSVLDELDEKLREVREAEETAKWDFVIEREMRQQPFRPMVLPWTRQGEDRRRFRKVLLLVLLFAFLFGGLPMVWELPAPDKDKPIEVPERLAKMVKKKEPPKPVERPEVKKEEEKKPEEKKPEEVKPQEKPKPTPQEVKQARAKAETKGVLAFKESFSDLMDDSVTSNLGVDARITNAGSKAGGAPGTRSLIAAQATGGSGGIANAQISRGGVGGGGGAITGSGVSVAKATSSIADMKSEDRPLTKGAGPARTDEEIQIVFDRYKSALYRIYNRELRNDPTLRGKMVLAITIEPDGSVSACSVQSTDLNSAALSKDIVDRVKRFNFGAKEGVPVTKILYPIDFLPAG